MKPICQKQGFLVKLFLAVREPLVGSSWFKACRIEDSREDWMQKTASKSVHYLADFSQKSKKVREPRFREWVFLGHNSVNFYPRGLKFHTPVIDYLESLCAKFQSDPTTRKNFDFFEPHDSNPTNKDTWSTDEAILRINSEQGRILHRVSGLRTTYSPVS